MRGLWVVLALAAGPAGAQDCMATAMSQTAMTMCAGERFEAADKALNAAYEEALAASRREAPNMDGRSAEEALRTAQRAWVAFRDAACEAQASYVEGGSMHPMAVTLCLERLTRARTGDLEIYVADREGL